MKQIKKDQFINQNEKAGDVYWDFHYGYSIVYRFIALVNIATFWIVAGFPKWMLIIILPGILGCIYILGWFLNKYGFRKGFIKKQFKDVF